MNKEYIVEFIETYRQHPALWKVKSKEYVNRNLKNAGYDALIEISKKYNLKADRDAIAKKIQSIRGCFRKELKKLETSKRTGTSTDDLYVPSLWYFDLLLFTVDQEMATESIENINSPLNNITEENDDDDDAVTEGDESQNLEENSQSDLPGRSDSQVRKPPTSGAVSGTYITHERRDQKRKRIQDNRDQREFLKACTEALRDTSQNESDENDTFGKYVAQKLKKMKYETQKMYAETLIMQVIQKGHLNQLTPNSIISESMNPSGFLNYSSSIIQHPHQPSIHSFSASTSTAPSPALSENSSCATATYYSTFQDL